VKWKFKSQRTALTRQLIIESFLLPDYSSIPVFTMAFPVGQTSISTHALQLGD
jgi:hypothetical protein